MGPIAPDGTRCPTMPLAFTSSSVVSLCALKDVRRPISRAIGHRVPSRHLGSVNGGRNPGHCGGAKAGQFELGGGRSRSALFDSAVASERPVGFGRVVEAQTIPGSTAGA